MSVTLLPTFFIGHGSPMNGIGENEFSRSWRRIGEGMPAPRAVLCVSAHWLTRGTAVTAMEHPRTLHDFGGFPRELFEARYPAPGSPALAREVRDAAPGAGIALDHEWGLDHGSWTILRHMFPAADVPVLQLSLDVRQPARFHYDLGRQLAGLRRKGFLLLGSGNMVHNLGLLAFDRLNESGYGFDWAHEMNALFRKHILAGDHDALIEYETLGPAARLAIPTPEHYYPLLYVLGALEKGETPVLFNDKAVGGSLTMTSVSSGPLPMDRMSGPVE